MICTTLWQYLMTGGDEMIQLQSWHLFVQRQSQDSAEMSNGPTQLHAVLSLPPLLRECINILAVPLPTTTHASTCYCNSVERSRYQMTNAYTARRNGIAKFRLICKQASEAGMQAVTGYCLRLSPLTPAGKAPEPLLEVARLLCKTNLQHLQVEVQISTGKAW